MFLREHAKSRRSRAGVLIVVWLVLTFVVPASAHNGPPFPIIENKKVGPCIVALWTHPDVGTGTFFVFVDPAPGGAIPDDLKIEIGVQPETGRLPEVLYAAERDEIARAGGVQRSGRFRSAGIVARAAGDSEFARQRRSDRPGGSDSAWIRTVGSFVISFAVSGCWHSCGSAEFRGRVGAGTRSVRNGTQSERRADARRRSVPVDGAIAESSLGRRLDSDVHGAFGVQSLPRRPRSDDSAFTVRGVLLAGSLAVLSDAIPAPSCPRRDRRLTPMSFPRSMSDSRRCRSATTFTPKASSRS